MESFEYALAILDRKPVLIGILTSLILAVVCANRTAKITRWAPLGCAISIFGLGAAISVTFLDRVGRYSFELSNDLAAACLTEVTRPWLSPESLLNTLVLVPLAIGLVLGSGRLWLSWALICCAGVGLEALQGTTGLGLCEVGDLVRNVAGGIFAAFVTWILMRATSIGDRVAQVNPTDSRDDQRLETNR